jgi:PAS domain S-box-containing protein
MANDKSTSKQSSELRQRAEKALPKQLPENLESTELSNEEMLSLIHELQVYQIELEMQNDEIRRVQHEIEESRNKYSELYDKYSNLYDCAPVGYFTISDKGKILEANLTGARMLGLDKTLLVGNPFSTYINRDDQDIFYHHHRKLIETKNKQTCDLKLVKKDGLQLHVQLESVLVLGADRRVSQVLSTVTDLSERRRAEEDKLALERQVQHAQKLESLGVLAGGIAHDFNNILVAILGNADLALADLSPMSPVRGNLQEIQKAVKRAAELANQMLAYSGKGRFIVEPINPGELIGEISHLLEVSITKKAELKFNLAENIPTFRGSVTQIRQIIMNLITNASEAIGDKSGVIALSTGAMDCDRAYLDDVNNVLPSGIDEQQPEGVYTYFEVADTGCGMNAETIEKIFDPFFTTKLTGRGLGMSAVLGIVRGHKGILKIDSEVGKGTTFRVLFPANEMTDNDFAVRRKDKAEVKDWRGSGTVLIADDEETVCAVGKQILEGMGFKVLTAPDGREALKVFREHADEIICVLLDLTMPHMDGKEAFRAMQRLHPGVRVILCSGYNEQDAIQHLTGLGLAGFIQKPFNMATLKEKVAEVLAEDESDQYPYSY